MDACWGRGVVFLQYRSYTWIPLIPLNSFLAMSGEVTLIKLSGPHTKRSHGSRRILWEWQWEGERMGWKGMGWKSPKLLYKCMRLSNKHCRDTGESCGSLAETKRLKSWTGKDTCVLSGTCFCCGPHRVLTSPGWPGWPLQLWAEINALSLKLL